MQNSSKTIEVARFFADTDRYVRNNFNIEARSLIVKVLLGTVEGVRLLDLGCGDGSLSLPFASSRNWMTLVDISPAMLALAERNAPEKYKARVTYVCSSLLDFHTPQPFDLVLCIGVLAHVDSVEQSIAKVASLVRPGGRCILQLNDSSRVLGQSELFFYSLYNRLRRTAAYRMNRLSYKQVISIATKYGLTQTRTQYHMLIVPGMGRLPQQWLLKYDRFVQRNRLLSRLATEGLILFEKEQNEDGKVF